MLRHLQRQKTPLTDAQRQMYASEATENFRLIPYLFSSPSSYILSETDRAPQSLQDELAEIGEYAELAHGSLDPQFIWDNLEALCQPDFPLHDYNALPGSQLIKVFYGDVARLQGYVTFRPQTRQLFVAFSGTSGIGQTLRNLRAVLTEYPGANGCSVHAGFWRMFSGARSAALSALKEGFRTKDVKELVLTGHSMGAAMSYLLALDIMAGKEDSGIPGLDTIPLKIAAFGSPRIGNTALAQHWRDTVKARNERGTPVEVYSVKMYNDGATMVPPKVLGYTHFAQEPYFFVNHRLYKIPPSEFEWSVFKVKHGESVPEDRHPKGGHNYYNSRDMEKLLREMKWLDLTTAGPQGWETRYRQRQQKGPRTSTST